MLIIFLLLKSIPLYKLWSFMYTNYNQYLTLDLCTCCDDHQHEIYAFKLHIKTTQMNISENCIFPLIDIFSLSKYTPIFRHTNNGCNVCYIPLIQISL